MSSPSLVIAAKATIDRAGSDLAVSLGIADFVDMDDTVNVARVLTGSEPTLLWRFLTMDEAPSDPMYHLMFLIGIKTTSDPANYMLLEFISGVKATFSVGSSLDIYNWSAAVHDVKLGNMLFTNSGVDAQVMDRESGVRMLTVEAMVLGLK